MGRTEVVRDVNAPASAVFDAVAHIENFREIVPDITGVEFLSEQHTGVGARFRETRRFGKRESSTELEVTEYVPGERVRLVADQGGTVWDTVFTTSARPDGGTQLTMVMDANAYKLAAKLINPLVMGMVRKAIEKDMDAVKAHCEASRATD